MDCSLPGSSVHGDSPGKNTGVGCHALLQVKLKPDGWVLGKKNGLEWLQTVQDLALGHNSQYVLDLSLPLSWSLRGPMCLMEELQQSEGLLNMNWTFYEEEIKLYYVKPLICQVLFVPTAWSSLSRLMWRLLSQFPLWLLYPSLE